MDDMRWALSLFPGRCWTAVELLLHGGEDQLFERIQLAADITGMPLVAAGDVAHARRFPQAIAGYDDCHSSGQTIG